MSVSRVDPVKKYRGRLAIPAKEGKLVSMGRIGVKFKISGDETNRAFSIVEHPVEPRTLVPPHLHRDTDEYSYVVEGQFGARIGDEILLAGPGEYILKPRGILSPRRDISITTPLRSVTPTEGSSGLPPLG